jgi:hypothetical protein
MYKYALGERPVALGADGGSNLTCMLFGDDSLHDGGPFAGTLHSGHSYILAAISMSAKFLHVGVTGISRP